MLNQQPIEKVARTATGHLDVHSIFYTIQGEGPFCGHRSVFIRLAGCNLQCPWCDTEYTQGRRMMHIPDIVTEVYELWHKDGWQNPGLVVITGGEPFRQSIDLGTLFGALVNKGFNVQVETNGTLPPPDENRSSWFYATKLFEPNPSVYIVCSPKAGKLNHVTASVACCFKYVLDRNSVNENDGLPMQALGHTANPYVARPTRNVPVYLQPMDAKDEAENKLNIQAVLRSCYRFGYILQLQVHKYIGVE